MPRHEQRLVEFKLVAAQLRQSGWTPQEVCTHLAKVIFDDSTKYNTVKGWYRRTFTDWPTETSQAQFRGNPGNAVSIQQRNGPIPTTSTWFPPRHRQIFPEHGESHSSQQASSANTYPPLYTPPYPNIGDALNDDATIQPRQTYHHTPSHHYSQVTFEQPYSMNQLSSPQDLPNGMDLQSFPESLSLHQQQHLPRSESSADASHSSAAASRPSRRRAQHHLLRDGCLQYPASQINGGREAVQAEYSAPQRPNDLSGADTRLMDLIADETPITYQQFLASDSLDRKCLESISVPNEGINSSLDSQRYIFRIDRDNNDGMQNLPSQQHQNSSVIGHEPTRLSNKHYRSSSILAAPTPPPQYPLPADPPGNFGVIRNRGNVSSWHPVRMEGSSLVDVDPGRFPTDNAPKRVKGVGTESRDSIVIHQEHLKPPQPSTPGTAAATRVPLTHQPVISSNVSVCSSLDSGYISILDSTILESMQSSFSTLKLTPGEWKTDYKEADDGYVEAEITVKGRWRISQIERMQSLVFGPET